MTWLLFIAESQVAQFKSFTERKSKGLSMPLEGNLAKHLTEHGLSPEYFQFLLPILGSPQLFPFLPLPSFGIPSSQYSRHREHRFSGLLALWISAHYNTSLGCCGNVPLRSNCRECSCPMASVLHLYVHAEACQRLFQPEAGQGDRLFGLEFSPQNFWTLLKLHASQHSSPTYVPLSFTWGQIIIMGVIAFPTSPRHICPNSFFCTLSPTYDVALGPGLIIFIFLPIWLRILYLVFYTQSFLLALRAAPWPLSIQNCWWGLMSFWFLCFVEKKCFFISESFWNFLFILEIQKCH